MKLPEGFSLSALNCGIKKNGYDLGLILFPGLYPAVGLFTANVNCSYSVSVSRENIKNPIKAILVNSGNANCFSHKRGYKDTRDITAELGRRLEAGQENILIASTGLIGKKLPKNKIIKSIPKLIKGLGAGTGSFARSILTTDTRPKAVSRDICFGKKKVTISGFAKGAGMISPNLATMLAFILTDADIGLNSLKKAVKEAAAVSFNSINIDGAESTNDSLFVASSRQKRLNKNQAKRFSRELKQVMLELAKMIVGDAEEATKFIRVEVKGAKNRPEAKRAASAVAGSVLFRSAMYGQAANPGRVIAALGQARIKVKEGIGIRFSRLNEPEVKVAIDLKRGKSGWVVYTSDITPEYVNFNAEYN